MNLFSLVLYGLVNLLMVVSYLFGPRGRFYEFPFWAGVIALGWFYPQAVGGFLSADDFPEHAYANGMLFASLCSMALWGGYALSVRRPPNRTSWLNSYFDMRRLYWAAAALCFFGFFFQWKLWSLPEEMLAKSQWSGPAVKYLFLASVFEFGFLVLWLMYLLRPGWFKPKLLIFLVPCFAFLIEAAFLRGRRSAMMNLVAYVAVGLWLARNVAMPRWFIISGMAGGLILINAIGAYRAVMMNKELSLSERITQAANTDYVSKSEEKLHKSGAEFQNYIYYRQAYADAGLYDYGLNHWNRLVFNYVPAQIFGSGFKESLMCRSVMEKDPGVAARVMYGHVRRTGSTSTGYCDAFGSFAWLGFIKFLLIGQIMGVLYRYALHRSILGMMLYMYVLTIAMQSITHGTNDPLVRVWVYFFLLGYPPLCWAKLRNWKSLALQEDEQASLSTA